MISWPGWFSWMHIRIVIMRLRIRPRRVGNNLSWRFKLKKTNILGIFNFLAYEGNVCYVYSLESPRLGDSNEHTKHTIIFVEDRKDIAKLSPSDS